MKGRFSISVVSEDLPKESCKGEIVVRDNKLKKIVDRVEFMIPKSLLNGLKATFDGRETETRIMLNWKVKF